MGQLLDKIFVQFHPTAVILPWAGGGKWICNSRAVEKDHFHTEIFIVSLKLLKSGIQRWLKEQINLKLIKMYVISSAGQRGAI